MTKYLVVAAAALLSFGGAQAGEGADADSVALVRAMRSDVILREASNEAISRATREGYYTEAQFECFRKLPASAFTDGLAGVVTQALSREEIAEALAFYQSPDGSKFVDYLFLTFARASGGSFSAKPADANFSVSVETMRAVRDFSATSAGKKLLEDRLMMKSPQSEAVARRVVGRQLSACGAKVPGPAR